MTGVTEVPSITTERLVLRAWRQEDLDPFAQMCADPEVARYLGGQTLDRDQSWRSIALFMGHWALRGYGLWVVERRADGRFIGRVGLWRPEGWPGLEVGWALTRSAWKQGYATEAARASMQFAWTALDATELISLIHPANHASQRVAERLGLRRDGRQNLGTTELLVYRCERPAESAG